MEYECEAVASDEKTAVVKFIKEGWEYVCAVHDFVYFRRVKEGSGRSRGGGP